MSILRDDNRVPIIALDSYSIEKYEPGPFIGGTTDARGDENGTNDPTTLFTVTGDVAVRIYAVCTATLVGAATIEVGVAGNTAELLTQVSNATAIAENDIWVDATVDDVLAATFSDIVGPILIVNGANIIETIGAANITAGELYYVCMWRPITRGAKLVAGA